MDYKYKSNNKNTDDNVKYITEIVDFVETGFQDVDRIIDMTEAFGIKDLSNEPEEIFERYKVFVDDAIEYSKRKDAENLYNIYFTGDDENMLFDLQGLILKRLANAETTEERALAKIYKDDLSQQLNPIHVDKAREAYTNTGE